MPVIKTADRVVVSVTATESGDWQVVSTPTGFQGVTSGAGFADNDYIHGFVRFENGEDWEVYDTEDDSTTHLLQITNVSGTVTIARPATPFKSSNGGARVSAGSGTHTLTISLGAGTMKRLMLLANGEWKTFTSADATPSVANYRLFTTAGSTAITRFDDMADGQMFVVRRGAADIVITHGADIVLLGGASITLTSDNATAMFVEQGGVARQVGGGGGSSSLAVAANQVSAANLASAAHAINTSGKSKGKLAYETTNDRAYMALGSGTTDKWRPLDSMGGLDDITPA